MLIGVERKTLKLDDPTPRRSAMETSGRHARAARPWSRLIHEMAGEDLHLARLSGWLVLLSVADLLTTYSLLHHGMGFYEANPVANWWFARWDMAGMTAFKFLLIGGAIGIAEIAERRRPGRGRLVLWIGIVGSATVFLKGLSLYVHHVVPTLV
jgi:hypothetical protein